jgi:hypothetical protein
LAQMTVGMAGSGRRRPAGCRAAGGGQAMPKISDASNPLSDHAE